MQLYIKAYFANFRAPLQITIAQSLIKLSVMRCIRLWCVYKTLSGLCFEAKQIHSASEFHHKIWKKNSFAWKTRTRKAIPYNIKVWIIEVRIIEVWLFLIIGEFGQEINNFRSSNTEQEAYISFLSSSFAAFTYILETFFRFSSAYISHGYTHLQFFRGTSRHAPVAFFSSLLHFAVDSVFSSQRLQSRGKSRYQQFLAKILLHKPWLFQKTFKTILLAVNVFVFFYGGKKIISCHSISDNDAWSNLIGSLSIPQSN